MTMKIYDLVKEALIERGWKIDPGAKETFTLELHEFIHPETGKKMTWIDAILEEALREPE